MTEASVIGPGSFVRGNVRGEGNLEILGRVEGDVNVSGDVTLGESAVVRGNIAAAQLTVAGAVQGDLRGNEGVQVARGARVVGDVTGPRIGIEPGALVRGVVRTDGEAPLAQPQRRVGAVGQPLRAGSALPPARPAAAPRLEPVRVAPPAPPPPVVEEATEDDSEPPSPPPKREREAPPPPVVPALGKNARAKKKKREG